MIFVLPSINHDENSKTNRHESSKTSQINVCRKHPYHSIHTSKDSGQWKIDWNWTAKKFNSKWTQFTTTIEADEKIIVQDVYDIKGLHQVFLGEPAIIRALILFKKERFVEAVNSADEVKRYKDWNWKQIHNQVKIGSSTWRCKYGKKNCSSWVA